MHLIVLKTQQKLDNKSSVKHSLYFLHFWIESIHHCALTR
jgi:hypothetical protein